MEDRLKRTPRQDQITPQRGFTTPLFGGNGIGRAEPITDSEKVRGLVADLL